MKPIKTLYFALLCIIFSVFICGCSNDAQFDTAKNDKKTFFAWMDGYLAAGENTQNPLALTMFFSKNSPPFQLSEISEIKFANINADIIIANLVTAQNDFGVGAKYNSYSFSFNVLPSNIGTYETDTIEIYFSDDTSKSYSIGNWVFDIGEQENPVAAKILDTWQTPVVASSGDAFAYSYIPQNESVKINKLWYGKEAYLESKEGVIFSDSISLKGEYTAPIKYIKTKIEVELDGKQFLIYGKGCYCGAVNLEEKVLVPPK